MVADAQDILTHILDCPVELVVIPTARLGYPEYRICFLTEQRRYDLMIEKAVDAAWERSK